MHGSRVKYWLILIGVLAAAYTSFVLWRGIETRAAGPANTASVRAARRPSAADMPAGPVADFTLTDQAGREFESKSMQGKVWVASFFFTNCPAVCWRMNQALSAWQQTHPDSAVRFVSITCDPDNDTPQALARYAEHFKADPARWTFLTGDIEKIKSIGQDSFKISVVEKDHTDRACVVDRRGQVRGRFRLTEPDQVEMLERLLAVLEAEETAQPHAEPAAEPPRDPASS
jgi:cytochrome oxidase Cu insertion factor (SCO1/SenC/PrrC family)